MPPILCLCGRTQTGKQDMACDLVGFDDGATLLALVSGLFPASFPDLLEVVPPLALHGETFRAVPSLQLVGGEGQVAVPAAQPALPRGQEDQVEMSAG